MMAQDCPEVLGNVLITQGLLPIPTGYYWHPFSNLRGSNKNMLIKDVYTV